MAMVVGKVFKNDSGWAYRISVDGGASGKFEGNGFKSCNEAASAMASKLIKVDSLYNSEEFALLNT
jgi:hypothetical protein